jgi:pimeloyl-ACP methyl ester carboxylesterase
VNLEKTTTGLAWDERNGVEIRRLDSASEIDHQAAEPVEYVVAGRSGGPLDVVALYAPKLSKTLIVSFHGSLLRSKFTLPRFEWRRTLSNLDAGVLMLADTTLELGEKVPLGWYIGTAEQDLAEEIAAVVQQVAADGGYDHILLAGSSGGGYAAMAISRRIPGSAAVSFSPQTRVGDYTRWVHQAFVNAAFPAYATIDAVEAEFAGRVNLRRLYAEPEIPNYVRYVQNSNDLGHIEEHYAPFAQVRSTDPATGGLDPTGRFRFVLEAMSKGHEPPARHRFLRNIQEAHQEFFGEELANISEDAK